MDISQESTLVHKRKFMDFLDGDNGQGLYISKISKMMDRGSKRLLVDLNDLRAIDDSWTRRILRSPSEYMQPLAEAVEETTRNLNPKYLLDGEEMHVGFEGQFGFHNVTPRELLSPFLGTLVSVEGIVTKCSLVRPKVVKSVHFCPTTKDFISREYRDITSSTGLPTGSVYPTRDDKGNLLVTEFGLSKYRDHQTLSIQEMPENSAPGQLPRSIDVIIEDDLVDECKPGDRVAIVGIYKAIPSKGAGSMNGVFRTVLVGNNVVHLNRDINTPVFTAEDLKNIKNISRRQDSFELLAESLAPTIFGHLWIKKAVILQLLGGVEKNLKNGTHIRGDVNVMMVGDPSVAKSQLLRAIMNIAPLAISTTGRGSSGVGLTAAVTTDQETGDRRLEAGAMVLADRGMVCIDEFDKMSDLDRVSIHEVMEQQTVTIAKAGIHASLNARCSVIAAANPIYGTYDRSLTPTKNIGLPDSLLSRFDLLFIVLDQMDPDIDRLISEHVLRMHRYQAPGDDGGLQSTSGPQNNMEDESGLATVVFVKYNRLLHGEKRTRHSKKEILTIKFLKKFVNYAKCRIQPALTEDTSEQIAQAYAEMRNTASANKSGGGTLPITARTLETIIRLSTAHAKLKLRSQVTKADVDEALKVMTFAISHKELTEVDEREQERALELERKRKAGEASGEGVINDDDNDDNPDGPESGDRRTPRRRRSTSSMPSRNGSHHQAGAEIDSSSGANMDVGTESNEPSDPLGVGQQNKEPQAPSGADSDIMGIPVIEVSLQREETFQRAFGLHLQTQQLSSMTLTEIIAVVNTSNPNPFLAGEISWILQRMQTANRVMLEAQNVYVI